jgi:outer membrane lipoprotein carrier protein
MRNAIVPALALLLAATTPALVAHADAPPAAAAPAAPTPLSDADATNVVNKVQAFYNQSNTFKSVFKQHFTAKLYNKEKTSSGSVEFSKPGKMNWVYTDPAGNRVVSDGSLLRVYEADAKQMFEQTVDKSQYPAALSFLLGSGKLADTFNFQLFDGASFGFKDGQVLVGKPKVPSPSYDRVLFYIDPATSQVRRVLIVDAKGNKNRFDFTNPKVNETVPAGDFTFTPPPGTSIVRP